MFDKSTTLAFRPFSAAANLQGYFPSASAELALQSCRTALDRQTGPCLILSGAGCGKTLLLDSLADAYSNQYQVATLACARTDARRDLLQGILFQVGQNYRALSESELRLELLDYLRPGPHCPHGLLLFVDDAHCLDRTILDELRVLSGVVRGGQLRCQLVMAGNQSLEENLSDPSQESFNQRIATRCYLTGFTSAEVTAYIRSQLGRLSAPRVNFDDESCRLIAKLTGGVPRLVNQLCDAALGWALRGPFSLVQRDVIQAAWSEIQRLPDVTGSDRWPGSESLRLMPLDPGSEAEPGTIEFGVLDADSNDGEQVGSTMASAEACPGACHSEAICAGRMVGGSSPDDKATVPFLDQKNSGFAELATSQDLRGRRTQTAVRGDLDPDLPHQQPDPPAGNKPTPPPNNPFEENFESEELVADSFFRSAIAHNRSAALLTRTLLDDYRVDSLPAESPEPKQAQRFAANSAIPPQSAGQRSHTGFDFAPHVANDLDLVLEPVLAATDDRDVLIVSRSNHQEILRGSSPPEFESDAGGATTGSTGKAIRMDYRQLFARLRQSAQESSTQRTS